MESNNSTGPPVPRGSEPVKECPKSLALEEHPPHSWEKPTSGPLWCDGILPEDEQPPCQMRDTPQKPECGEPAPTKVRVKTALVDAYIDVCRKHKAAYDSKSARLRSNRRNGTDMPLPRAS